MDRCPCLSGLRLEECCGPLLAGAPAPTAERLMRSRFTAFARGDLAHLVRTWDPRTRPEDLALDPDVRWYRLDVRRTWAGGERDDEGVVEFAAHHRWAPGRRPEGAPRGGVLHEVSRFRRDDGRWLYVAALDGPPPAGGAGPRWP
ncbi:YchJ family protein [Cellulomonas endophytica]|uniref:YchJ family protein n=1 Tax=Cellulomonas endophytica TaxID=2494735 RepID=UPI0010136515|nr:YchJ family metal-binding protein [Cellulomonas endophytica]